MYPPLRSLAIGLALLCALARPATAQLLLNVSGGEIVGYNLDAGNYGWEFEVLVPLEINALAFWDDGQDGFVETHTVGLWTQSGSLLASTTFDAGVTGVLSGEFRTLAIAPLTLGLGRYRVAGTDARGGDALGLVPALNGSVTLGANAFFVAAAYSSSSAFSFPDTPTELLGFFGPNLVATLPTPTAVPEASTFAVASLIALAGILVRRERRRELR